MSFAQASWSVAESTDRPTTLTFRRSNSGLIFAIYPSSVVHTGVKSFGCENSTAQESPIQSWNLIRPSLESASKSGAISPICKDILTLLLDPNSRSKVNGRPRRANGQGTSESGSSAGARPAYPPAGHSTFGLLGELGKPLLID